ncbi:glycosyltransferase [Phocaeicola plebeius]|jgi:mannosyltransferase OCH1-like enzyme|uniref:glycosyltransferase family 32 protein n=1 Tax=Phocaeicola plebeius TaxID=310297 RepID=UPI003207AB68
MIPKIIHYCWLSNDPYPPLINQCIESWKTKLPDYEFILWDTKRIDINSEIWLKQCFENKKYAFAADYIRCYALYHYGGIYLDADVEVIKSFNPLLDSTIIMGEEASGDIEAAVIGSEKGSKWLEKCLEYYKNRPFIKPNGSYDMRPIPLLLNQIRQDFFPSYPLKPFYYFSPKDYNIGKIYITNQTYCIHHFDGKWLKKGFKYKLKIILHKILYTILGRKGHNKAVKFIRKIKRIQ